MVDPGLPTKGVLYDSLTPIGQHCEVSWDNPYLLVQCETFQSDKIHCVLIERIFEHQESLTVYLNNPDPHLPPCKIELEHAPSWAPEFRKTFHEHKGTFLPSIFAKPIQWFTKPKNIILSLGVLLTVLTLFYQGFTHLYLMIPEGFDAYLGKKVKAELMKSEAACNNLEMNGYLNGLVERLQTDSGHTYHASIIKTKIENAYALPGGDIVFTSSLLEKSQSEEELLGIMAHEMTHVEKRHGIQQLMRYVGLGIIGTVAFTEGIEALSDPELVATILSVLLVLEYSRQFEQEADQGAMEKLLNKNINPLGIKDFFNRASETAPGSDNDFFKYISSHPMTRKRIEFFESFYREDHPYEKLNQSLFWKAKGYIICP